MHSLLTHRHATSVRQGNQVSLGISPVPCATGYNLLLSHPGLSRNQLRPVSDSVGLGSI